MAVSKGGVTADEVRDARLFFAELLTNGAVLEYNGQDIWYDVHPALRQGERFQHASRETRNEKPTTA